MVKVGIFEPKKGQSYYSLRHNFRDALSSAEIQDSVITSLMGHEDERVTFNTYGRQIDLSVLHKAICKIDFNMINCINEYS